jgi:hypothetical protein
VWNGQGSGDVGSFTGLKMPGYLLGSCFEMEWQSDMSSLCVSVRAGGWTVRGVDIGSCSAEKAALALSIAGEDKMEWRYGKNAQAALFQNSTFGASSSVTTVRFFSSVYEPSRQLTPPPRRPPLPSRDDRRSRDYQQYNIRLHSMPLL